MDGAPSRDETEKGNAFACFGKKINLSIRNGALAFGFHTFTCWACSYFCNLRAQKRIRNKLSERICTTARDVSYSKLIFTDNQLIFTGTADTTANSCNVVQNSLATDILSVFFSGVGMSSGMSRSRFVTRLQIPHRRQSAAQVSRQTLLCHMRTWELVYSMRRLSPLYLTVSGDLYKSNDLLFPHRTDAEVQTLAKSISTVIFCLGQLQCEYALSA